MGQNPPVDMETKRELFGQAIAAYVLNCVAHLDKDKLLRLVHISEQTLGLDTWSGLIESQMNINKEFVVTVYDGYMKVNPSPRQAIDFILRGLGLPNPYKSMDHFITDPSHPCARQQ